MALPPPPPPPCSAHLVLECGERSLQALLAGLFHGSGAGPDDGGDAAAAATDGGEPAPAMDDLLFFADTQGDASMFGQDWGAAAAGSDDDDDDDESGGGLGRNLPADDLSGGDE